MSWAVNALVLCTIFGYGFSLGWWARGQRLKGQEKLYEILTEIHDMGGWARFKELEKHRVENIDA